MFILYTYFQCSFTAICFVVINNILMNVKLVFKYYIVMFSKHQKDYEYKISH